MKTTTAVLCAALIALAAACSDNPARDYGKALTSAPGKARAAVGATDMAEIHKAIEAYQIANGKYPATLEEVSTLAGKQLDSAHYNYDPATGALSLK